MFRHHHNITAEMRRTHRDCTGRIDLSSYGVTFFSSHESKAEMVWPRADGMAEIAHNVNRRYRYIKEAGIPFRIRTTVFQFILLITRVSALSSAQQQRSGQHWSRATLESMQGNWS